MIRLHLDTDLGGDIDDLCALAMLLRWENIEWTGITTVGETQGRRAGYVRSVLALEGRGDIPVAAGADVSDGFYRSPGPGYLEDARYWPEAVQPAPGPPEEALELLKHSIEQGAIVIAIGPLTNLHLLERRFPGILGQANLFLMAGYILPIRPGFPHWGNEMDWNVQVDVASAKYVMERAHAATLIPLTVTVETALRRKHLPLLEGAGALGQLIARQARAFAQDEQYEIKYGATCAGVPDDIINFQHDPLACAIAVGWTDGVEMEEVPLLLEEKDGYLHERIDPMGKPFRLVTWGDGPRFSQFWLDTLVGR